MTVQTFEGIVDENGRIQIIDGPQLPRETKVFVVVPETSAKRDSAQARIHSPRLVHPEDAADFALEVIRDFPDV